MNKKVILPCPFCGEIPVLEREQHENEIIEKWNKRNV